ncbi:MAG: DNA polymerase III subunit alpha [Nitrospinae bacterium]|nr:DNA polymerase III subunit alpha [Nitrospinota bacterium]MBF0633566.1 DNA polymerase III subunit alpha [Nitrospinota bacterium]
MTVLKHSDFVHLHLHSQYSLLDGAIHFDKLLDKVNEMAMPAVAITDHGVMFGAVEFYNMARKKGVKPIIGCEIYIAPGSRFEKGATSSDQHVERYHHLVLLAQNKKGYQNLCKLVTAGFMEGFHYKPRVDRELLAAHSDGLIALSACLHGEVAKNLASGNEAQAREAAAFYNQTFPGRFYLELQDHGMERQRKVNKLLIPMARDMGIPLVATNDAHYINREDAPAHDALLCIGTGKTLAVEDRLRYEGDQFYVKSPDEMKALFKDVPEAISNTIRITEDCNFVFDEGKYHLPRFPIPSDTTVDDYLAQVADHGLNIRFINTAKAGKPFSDEKKEEYRKRLRWELETISKMGFPGYFLITWDFIKHARDNGIPVGPGRGSAAGSMVSYALRITDLDPIEYGLIFERFLNPERISMPDIDIDFCMDRRGEVINYVRDKYGGSDHVAQIITFGAMKAKAVVRDVARVMGLPYADADRIAKLIPNDLKMTIDEALKREPRLKKQADENEQVERLLILSRTLEGTARHASTHAAGVVISPEPLTTYMPLYKSGEDVITQYQMTDIEKLGLLKMDFLGLRTLTVMDNTVKTVRAKKDPAFDLEMIPLDDKQTYQLLASARTSGVFQLESSGMRDLIRKMKPTDFFDIIALVALYRPGPINSGMADQYVRRKHGNEKVELVFPDLGPIIKETYGVIVYQEQVMKIANVLSGFTLGQADSLRKAMGKKDSNLMANLRDKFVEGAVAKKYDKKKVTTLWEQIEKFGEYGFNKSHSACYALVAYQTAYLKAHHPAEYMASLITSEMGNTDKVIRYIQELREMGIKVLPPSVNESMSDFTVTPEGIRFGLAAVKGIGESCVAAIIEARDKHGAFTSLSNFAETVDLQSVNKRALEALVKCGAFDSFAVPRAALLATLEETVASAQKTQRDREVGQFSMFGALAPAESPAATQGNGKKILEWPEKERLAHEKEALGFYISGHPLNEKAHDLKLLSNFNTSNLENAAHDTEVRLGGVVIAKKTQSTKKGEMMAFLTLEDLHGVAEIIVFPKVYSQCVNLLEQDDPVFIKGIAKVDDEGSVKVNAEEVMDFETAKARFTNGVRITVSTPGLEKETLMDLRKLMEQHKGKCPVSLHFIVPGRGEVSMRTSGLNVNPSREFIGAAEELLGEESVLLE